MEERFNSTNLLVFHEYFGLKLLMIIAEILRHTLTNASVNTVPIAIGKIATKKSGAAFNIYMLAVARNHYEIVSRTCFPSPISNILKSVDN